MNKTGRPFSTYPKFFWAKFCWANVQDFVSRVLIKRVFVREAFCAVFLLAAATLIFNCHLHAQTQPTSKLLSDPFDQENHYLYRVYVDAAQKKIAHQMEGDQRKRAIVDACNLYMQMQLDPAVAESEFLTGRKRKLLAILRRVEKELNREIRQQLASQSNGKGKSKRKTSRSPDNLAVQQDRLSNERNVATDNANPLHSPQEQAASEPLDPLSSGTAYRPTDGYREQNSSSKRYRNTRPQSSPSIQTQAATVDSQYWELAYSLESGPSQVIVRSGGAIVGDPTNLINLIQTTVTPDVWDVNGGTASIGYYQRIHALVIRAPWTTHDSTGRLLNGLRE